MNSTQYGYANQGLGGQSQGERHVSLGTIQEDLKRRIDRLNDQCEKFEKLRAENDARLAELNKLGAALAALSDPTLAEPAA